MAAMFDGLLNCPSWLNVLNAKNMVISGCADGNKTVNVCMVPTGAGVNGPLPTFMESLIRAAAPFTKFSSNKSS